MATPQQQKDLATFEGAPTLGLLSARLAIGDERVTDQDVTDALGADVVPVFRFAQDRMAGRVRKTTREPAFCHSADIALRAADLGYDAGVIAVGLLHDVVEDSTRGLRQPLELIAEIGSRFGEQVATDVRLVTNRYAMLLDTVCLRLGPDAPVHQSSLPKVREAVGDLYWSLEPDLRQSYEHEFHRLLFFFDGMDLSDGARHARLDHGYSLKKELGLHAYRPFVEQLADDALDRAWPIYERALVAKGLDLVDNLRTTEIAAFDAIERMLAKAEAFLDKTFFLHDEIRRRGLGDATFVVFYDYVKHHLVEQLAERRRALSYLSDSRFAYLASFLMESIGRVQTKYQLGTDLVGDLRRLRAELRRLNGLVDPA